MTDGTVIEGTTEEITEVLRLFNGEEEKDVDQPKYKTENRPAKVGERILITNAEIDEPYENGAIFEVASVDCDGDVWTKEEERFVVRSEYEVIIEENGETAEQANPKFVVGDYAKVVGPTYFGNIKEGTITKIKDPIDYEGDYLIVLPDGSKFDYAKPHNLEKVEITSRDLSFLNAGREVNEYKVGDIVRVLYNTIAHPKQSIIEITGIEPEGIFAKGYDAEMGGVEEWWYDVEYFELIAPAESRVDNKGDRENE